MTQRYTAPEVAKILKLPETRLRSCLRAALLPTTEPLSFSFQDLLLLKTTKGLLDAQVPVARIRQMLQSLKRQLPSGQQIWSVRIYADGRRIVVWDAAGRWHPDSGQFLFDFEPRVVAEELQFPVATGSRAPSLDAEQWFTVALEAEACPEESFEAACEAYRHALELDPAFVAAHINLGRLLQQAGDFDRAESCYRTALRYAADEVCAHFNLGVLLEERGEPAAAIESYRRAVEIDPDFRDAHYNLALIFESYGQNADAIRHFAAARRLSRRHMPGRRLPRRLRPR
jgi:tetratricopeptide (TPR) repeat protein